MKRKVILLVGISGGGKSTFVQEYLRTHGDDENIVVCSADDGHMVDVDLGEGEIVRQYKFDPAKIGQAHSDCLNKYIMAFYSSVNTIIVDNTNLTKWERQNYFEVAGANNAFVEVHQVDVRTIEGLKLCISRNVHKVPAATIADMALRFERVEASEHYAILGVKDYLL